MTWWRRNLGWLLALIPALALALAVSSFRLTQLYLPWEWSQPTYARSSVGTLEHTFKGHDAQQYGRAVTVEVLGVEAVPSFEGHAAIVGATMWQVDLRLSAEPDQLLMHCTVELADAEGTRYGYAGGRRAADPDDPYYNPAPIEPYCVPEDAPGPTQHPITGEYEPSPVERPASWEVSTALVLPDGYEPAQVRVGWDRPHYLVLEIP